MGVVTLYADSDLMSLTLRKFDSALNLQVVILVVETTDGNGEREE